MEVFRNNKTKVFQTYALDKINICIKHQFPVSIYVTKSSLKGLEYDIEFIEY